jgi:hypothetical protein
VKCNYLGTYGLDSWIKDRICEYFLIYCKKVQRLSYYYISTLANDFTYTAFLALGLVLLKCESIVFVLVLVHYTSTTYSLNMFSFPCLAVQVSLFNFVFSAFWDISSRHILISKPIFFDIVDRLNP